MSVCRHRDKWKAVVWDGGKRVASKSGFSRKSDARAWHDDTLRRIKQDGTIAESSPRFEDLVEKFRAWHLPSVSPGSRAAYETDICLRIAPFFRFRRLDSITPGDVEAFREFCRKTLKAPRSINGATDVLRLLLNKGVKWRMLKESPFALEHLPIPVEPYEWWSEKWQVGAFLAEAKRRTRYYPLYLAALSTGLRMGELVGLSVEDIDLEEGAIHVHRQWLYRAGDYGPPKHNKERWVSFDPEGELARVLGEAAVTTPNPEVLFSSREGRVPAKGKFAGKTFKRIQETARIPVIKFHGLRHTFASWFMREHDNVWDLKSILGHADVQTTMRYAHHGQKARQRVLDLSGFPAPESPPVHRFAVVNGGKV